MTQDFEASFATFYTGTQKISDDYAERQHFAAPAITVARGSKYIRMMRDGAAHCFIDRTNGDVLKAASFKAPAKHARGNIYDGHNGLKYMGPYGPAYLR